MVMEIKTGFGRPRTLGLIRATTIYLYESYKEVYEKAVELARREGISFSELVSRALREYVENHYPGNPQLPIESYTPNGLKPIRLEAKLISRELTKMLKRLNDPRVSEEHKRWIRREGLPKTVLKLARLNKKLRDNRYSGLIELGEKEIFGEDG